MKRCTRLLVTLGMTVLALSAPGSVGYAQEYVERVNDELPPDPMWFTFGFQEIAYRWTAENTFDLTEVKWHATELIGATVRIRVDTGTTPGQVLRTVFFSSGLEGWQGAEFDEPPHVEAGETYFVSVHNTGEYTNYIAEDTGERLDYYWKAGDSDATTGWQGPWINLVTGVRMIQFYGIVDGGDECEGDVNGDDVVDPLDSGFILARFGCDVGEGDESCDAADANGDLVVDPLDVGFVLARFGECE